MKVHANKLVKSAYARVLAIPSFRALWFGQIASQLSINTLLFVLALRIYQTTGSNAAVSGLFLSFGIPAVLFGMVAGTVVDRLDKRTVLLACDILRAVLVFTLVFFSGSIWFVYVLMFFNAVITQFYVPSEAPTIPLLVPNDFIVTANSLFAFTFYSSLALGSLLAGPLLRLFGHYGIFVFLSSLFVIAATNVWRLRTHEEGTRSITVFLQYEVGSLVGKIFHNLGDGVAYIRARPVLQDAILLLTGTQIILAILGSLGPGFADRMINIDVRDSSLFIIGPAVLGIILGALWVGQLDDRISAKKLIRVGVLGAGIILIIIAILSRLKGMFPESILSVNAVILPVLFLLFFLLGVANSFLDVPANSTLQQHSDDAMRGRVYGMLAAAVGGVGVLPVVAGGVLADVVGVGKVVFFLGLLITLYGMLRGRYNKQQ